MNLHKCQQCGNYTLKPECEKCKTKTINPHPARYSPQDKYGKYRRQMKKQDG